MIPSDGRSGYDWGQPPGGRVPHAGAFGGRDAAVERTGMYSQRPPHGEPSHRAAAPSHSRSGTRKVLRVFAVAALALLLTGCLVRLAYNYSDWLIPRWVDRYVTLDEEQRAFLDATLDARLQWHCAAEMPRYEAWFQDARRTLFAGDLGPERMWPLLERLEGFMRAVLEEVADDLAQLAATLSDEQVEELLAELERREEDLWEEYVAPGPEARAAARADRMDAQLRRWYGPLGREQRRLVEAWSAALATSPEEWLENRVRWRGELAAVLEMRDRRPEFDRRLTALLLEPDALWDDDYRARERRAREQMLKLFTAVHQAASGRQLRYLERRLESWRSDMDRLACDGEVAMTEAVERVRSYAH